MRRVTGFAAAACAIAFVLAANASARTDTSCPTSSNQSGKNLNGASFVGCNLAGFNFSGANLNKATFAGANLTNANFKGANLNQNDFDNAKVDGAAFDGDNLNQSTFVSASGTHSTFTGANMNGAALDHGNFSYANVTGANSNKVTCVGTNLFGLVGKLSCAGSVSVPSDTTPPTIHVPSPITAEATSASGASVGYTVTATDNVDASPSLACAPASGSVLPLGTTTVSCTSTDSSGNTAHASFTVTVRDTTPPALTLPSTITREATSGSGATVSYATLATDLVDGILAASCAPSSGSVFHLGTTTVTCTATDSHHNTSSGSFAVKIVDTTTPVVTVPANQTAEATSAGGAAVTFTATASDTVDGALTPSCSPASGSTFPLGSTTVPCSATDAHSNTGSASFTVTVHDTTAPTLTLPSDRTAEATGTAGASVSFSTSAADLVDGAVAPSCSPASGSLFPVGTTSVSCTATDGAGNQASGSFLVTVNPTPPGAPTITSVTSGAGEALVSFDPPASNGGLPITSYTVTSSPGGFTAICVASPCLVTGLTNGVAYTFTVTATNSLGSGPASTPTQNAVVPVGSPSAPTITSVDAGNGQATISFSAPADNGGLPVSSYTVVSDPGAVTATCVSSPCVVTGLTDGVAYTFAVTATNAAGSSQSSASSVPLIPVGPPGAPTITGAIPGNGSASVSFLPPASDGGSPITSYTVTSSPGGVSASGAGSPIVVNGLTDGVAYTFSLTATNSLGTGSSSASSASVIPAGPPGAPTITGVTLGAGSASVAFSPPASDGGSPISGYVVTPSASIGLPATKFPFDSGVSIAAGQSALVSASGTWAIGGSFGNFGPGGNTSATQACGLVPGAFAGELVGSLNGGATWFVLGAGPTSVPGPGELLLATNDCPPAFNFTDNSGFVTLSVTLSGTSASGSASPIVVSGLTNGQRYTFTVFATNATSAGPMSPPSAPVTPGTVPDAPNLSSVNAGDSEATVAFSAGWDGGSPITSYTVAASPGGATVVATSSPVVMTGLTNGQAYTFTIQATNQFGTGPATAPSSAVTPTTVAQSQTLITWLDNDAPYPGYVDVLTGHNVQPDGSETSPYSGLETAPALPVPPSIVDLDFDPPYLWVTYDAVRGVYMTWHYTSIDLGSGAELDEFGDVVNFVDLSTTKVMLLTLTGTAVDLINAPFDQVDPITFALVSSGEGYAPLPTPPVFQFDGPSNTT